MTRDQAVSARAELDRTEAIVGRLHKMCCEPDRSPRMEAIESLIGEARSQLVGALTDEVAGDVTKLLRDAGSRLGALQVECCAEARMPLYAEALESLTATQLNMNRELGRGH